MQGRSGRFANTKLQSDTFTASHYIKTLSQRRNTLMIINVLKTGDTLAVSRQFIHQCEYNNSRLMQGRSGRFANTKLHSDTFTASHWIKTLSQRRNTLMIINVLKTGATLAVSEPFIHQCEHNNSRLMQGHSGRFANTKLHSDTFTASHWIKTLSQRRNTLMIINVLKTVGTLAVSEPFIHQCEYNISRLMQGRSGRFANTKLHSDTFTASHWIKTLSQRRNTLMILNVLKTGGTLAVSEPFIHQCEYNKSRLMQGRSGRFANANLHSDTFTASHWIKTLSQRRNTLMIINVLKTGGTLAVSEPFIHQCEYNNSRLMQGRLGRFANTKLHSDTFTASHYINQLRQRHSIAKH